MRPLPLVSALVCVLLLQAAPTAASPRMPPTLEELIVTCDLIAIVKVRELPQRTGDRYAASVERVLKGEASGQIEVQAEHERSDMPLRSDQERSAAYERGSASLLLFLHRQKDGDGYYTDVFRRLPASELQFGLGREPRPTADVLAAIRALVSLNDPELETSDAVDLWVHGLRSKNVCLVSALVERAGGRVAWGPPRERIAAQRELGAPRIAAELRRLVAHEDAEVRALAALYLRGLIDAIEDPAQRAAERGRAAEDLRPRLDDPDAGVRARVLCALAELGDAGVRLRILELLRDAEAPARERQAALWSVGYLTEADPSQKGMDLVVALLGTLEDPELARYAVGVLRRVTGEDDRRTVAAWIAWRDALIEQQK